MPRPRIVELFAGPGGWDEGARFAGLPVPVGLEWDAAACSTRNAAGHLTIRADVARYALERFIGVSGVIASPPCGDWSSNGGRAGRAGTSGHLIDQVPRWVDALRPRWVACEQVPPVLGAWRAFAELFRSWGYSAWAGILNTADYGVPQTRQRAILIASLDRVALPPTPTHAEHPAPGMFCNRARWVSMADALGWDPALVLHTSANVNRVDDGGRRVPQRVSVNRPAPTVDTKAGRSSWKLLDTRRDQREDGTTQTRTLDRPAPAVSTIPGQWQWVDEGGRRRNVTRPEVAALQAFRADYPWRGNRVKVSEQIGNAVPPPFAAAVLRQVAGV